MTDNMTSFTLRVARKIETRIGEYINQGPTTNHEIHASNNYPEKWLKESVDSTNDSLEDMITAINIRFNIRSKINQANYENSINALILERKQLIEESKMWQAIIDEFKTVHIPVTDEIVKHKLDQLNNSINSGNEYASSMALFITITEDTNTQAKRKLLYIRHELEQIDAKLATLNSNTEITINSKQHDWLIAKNIIQ